MNSAQKRLSVVEDFRQGRTCEHGAMRIQQSRVRKMRTTFDPASARRH